MENKYYIVPQWLVYLFIIESWIWAIIGLILIFY